MKAEFVAITPFKSSATEKSWQWVALVRTMFGLAILGEILGAAVGLFAFTQQNTQLFMAAWLLLAPNVAFVLYAVLSMGAFPFEYSFLGTRIPASPPIEWQAVGRAMSSVVIGSQFHASLPCLTCLPGPGGIQLFVLTYPPVFIATQQILSISPPSWRMCTIEHSSSEIRGPIRVMQSVVAEMYRCMPELALVRS